MKEWLKSALIRAIKTMAQTAVALIGTSQFISEVNWTAIGSAVVLAGILSLLTSCGGIPEANNGEAIVGVTVETTNGKHASTEAVEVDATPATQSTTLSQEEAEALLAEVKAEGTD